MSMPPITRVVFVGLLVVRLEREPGAAALAWLARLLPQFGVHDLRHPSPLMLTASVPMDRQADVLAIVAATLPGARRSCLPSPRRQAR